jgi:hypothetical protein
MVQKVLVLSGYDDKMQILGSLCTQSHAIYAAWNGYAHEVVRQYESGSHPSWQKLRLLLERYKSYDYILWIDADAVITNVNIRVENLAGSTVFTCSQDWCAPENECYKTSMYISAGNFILRRNEDTERFLKTAQKQIHFENQSEWEQSAIMACMRNDPWMNSQVTRLHRNAMNSVCAEVHRVILPWARNHFLCHLTGLGEHEYRIPHVPKYNKELILNIISNLPQVINNDSNIEFDMIKIRKCNNVNFIDDIHWSICDVLTNFCQDDYICAVKCNSSKYVVKDLLNSLAI